MSATGRLHGAKALVYINGTELASARGYSIDVTRDSAEAGAFGEVWKVQKGGQLSASGSLDNLLEHDQMQLYTAATAGICSSTNVMIYPNRLDITCVISFSAYFGVGWSGDVGSIQMNPGTFTVDGAVTLTGFS